jgi:hypothetical protein
MNLPAAEGGITLCEDHLRTMLADCPRFRTFARNAADRQAALERIYIDDLPEAPEDKDAYSADDLRALRPFAIITTANQGGYAKARVAANTYAEAGKLHIVFEEDVEESEADDIALLERNFKNTLGVIQNELLARAYTAPDEDSQYLAIDLITFHGPHRCPENSIPDEGDHHFALFDVQHGVGVR